MEAGGFKCSMWVTPEVVLAMCIVGLEGLALCLLGLWKINQPGVGNL